jgi:lysophospholipase L1-like esterase
MPWVRAGAVLAITFLLGCAPDSTGDETGTAGTGGGTGAAGTSGAAGTTGAAGTMGAGGTGTAGTTGAAGSTTGVAGTSGTAGSSGTAGTTGGGGNNGTAGTTGVAGASGTGGGTGGGGAGRGGNGGGTAGRGGNGGGAAGRGGNGGGGAGRGGTGGAAGAAGGSGGGSGGGAAGYNPCAGNPCRILPIGDSITFGINQEGSYRIELFHKAVMAQQKITYTGTLQNGPTTVDGMTFPRRYEATSGITINGISDQITRNMTLNMPSDIMIVHIGTNDMYMNTSTANPTDAPANLGKLLDKLIAAQPNALIVVAKIIPLGLASSAVTTYNNAIPNVVQTRVTAGHHLMIVDLNTGFPSGDISSDGVHPNVMGYAWMGDKLYDALGSLFPK